MASDMRVMPMTIREANSFVANFHRHSKPVQGAKFAIGLSHVNALIGVAIIGRPVARRLQDGFTAELTRCCVVDGSPKGACSMLYGRAWRIWQQMGGLRMVTYTLQSESGASLRGAGWKIVGETEASDGWMNRPGREWQDVYAEPKFRWAVGA